MLVTDTGPRHYGINRTTLTDGSCSRERGYKNDMENRKSHDESDCGLNNVRMEGLSIVRLEVTGLLITMLLNSNQTGVDSLVNIVFWASAGRSVCTLFCEHEVLSTNMIIADCCNYRPVPKTPSGQVRADFRSSNGLMSAVIGLCGQGASRRSSKVCLCLLR